MEQKYGAICYDTFNIGDEIQTIAAMRFLPQVDSWVYRERISKFKAAEKHKIIMNAWWMYHPKNFPPSDALEPLLLSMHFHPRCVKKMFRKKTRKYFAKHGPVGCRDFSSLEICKKYNVDAYFSGCLTTTLQANSKIKREDFILTVDIPEHIVQEIKARTSRKVISIFKSITPVFDTEQRMLVAKIMLGLFHRAHCVVTQNIHTALPCLAFETPVLFFSPKSETFFLEERTNGLINLFHHTNEKQFLDDKDIYNFDTPPSNPEAYLEMRNNLIKKCSDFTSFDNEQSLIDENMNSTAELLKMLEISRGNARKILKLIFGALFKAINRRKK